MRILRDHGGAGDGTKSKHQKPVTSSRRLPSSYSGCNHRIRIEGIDGRLDNKVAKWTIVIEIQYGGDGDCVEHFIHTRVAYDASQ